MEQLPPPAEVEKPTIVVDEATTEVSVNSHTFGQF